ncbi:MAG: DUF4238 domain-containing protein [Sulfuricaulis sp.]
MDVDASEPKQVDKKRHHYVPKAYLNHFCDTQGRVRVYLKDYPDKAIQQTPENIAFHKYYYSQPLPGGGKDHNTLEDTFSVLESKWPPIVARLMAREDVNNDLEDIFSFIALQRTRVPASRDASEGLLAAQAKATLRILDSAGKLTLKPEGYEDIVDRVKVAIDPHQSIHAMVHLINGMESVFSEIGIGALHNTTHIPFLTSDNPVIWFDPSVPEDDMRPYVLQPGGPITLLFPVSPTVIIYGHSSMRAPFAEYGFCHGDLPKAASVKMMNRTICRFAYRMVFACDASQEAVIRKHAALSPVLKTDAMPTKDGAVLFNQYVFGKRQRKPKWEEEDTE